MVNASAIAAFAQQHQAVALAPVALVLSAALGRWLAAALLAVAMWLLRVLRRMSRTTFLAGDFVVSFFHLIVSPPCAR